MNSELRSKSEPLLCRKISNYPSKFLLQYYSFDPPKAFDLYDLMRGGPIEEKTYSIIFGINASNEDFTQYKFLETYDGPGLIVHQDVLEVLQKECPNDFQAFQIEIKNLDNNIKSFTNKDYFILNVINEIKAIDYQNSVIQKGSTLLIKRLSILAECMNGHHLAIEADFHPILYISPKLAQNLKKFRGAIFLSAEDAYHEILPHEVLLSLYEKDPELANDAFMQTLSFDLHYELLIRFIQEIPKNTLIALVDMALSRSLFYLKRCNEILELIGEKPRSP